MYKDSSAFVGWATGCKIIRGYMDISDPSLGMASAGDSTMALGKALSNGPVSLGDAGYAVCTFMKPLMNGMGPDFAVFENGFDDTFLELAFVEVSSDGSNFFRFPAHSLSDTITQTGSFGATDATKINNLAGKYRGGYGVPFDLSDIPADALLNKNSITHILVRDVVGSLDNNFARRDSYQNKINDPWPTAFPQGGFDLDAIGVINENTVTYRHEWPDEPDWTVFPNPVEQGAIVHVTAKDLLYACISDHLGSTLVESFTKDISTAELKKGLHFLYLQTKTRSAVIKFVVR